MSRLETDIRRRAELRDFLKGDLDAILAKEAKQQAARVAAREIGWHVARAVQHAAWVRR